jgi:Leucine-rich repeat (LRR) protein
MSDDDIEADKKVTKEEEKAVNTNTLTITLSDNYLTSIALSAKKLGSLDLSDNKLTSGETAALQFTGCDKLSSLTLTDNKTLTSLKGIETLKELATLTANKTGITEIPDLKELKKLTTVNLSNTDLESLSGLKGNEYITTLTMTECLKLKDIKDLVTLKKLSTANFTKCTALDNTSIKDAFGTPKNGDKKAELVFVATSKLNLTLTGCKGITEYSIFEEYGNMKVTYDKPTTKK